MKCLWVKNKILKVGKKILHVSVQGSLNDRASASRDNSGNNTCDSRFRVCDRKESVGVEEKRDINGFYLKAGRT